LLLRHTQDISPLRIFAELLARTFSIKRVKAFLFTVASFS
jgi:hypothetical protein